MLPTHWDPFRDLSKELNLLHREMDDMFRRTFGVTRDATGECTGLGAPAVNTYVKDQTFYVEVELPGVKKDQLDVHVDGNMLIISGERSANREVKDQEYLIRETRCGSFRRRLILPEGANPDKILAGFKNGILEVSMPMEKKGPRGRKVTVTGEEDEG